MHKFYTWVAAGVIITGIFMTIYGVGQQVLRQSANDPQSYIAEDIAAQLDKGAQPTDLLGRNKVLEKESAPFTGIYNLKSQLLVTDATYHGKELKIPAGVLGHAGSSDPYTITWQPASDLRLASVTVKAKGYYVVTARSLANTESRIDMVGLMVLIGWLGSLVALAVALFLHRRIPAYTRSNE
ncbi:MAG: hypothetical protein JWO41_328 [Candidatus Saccharibacteria bacterium]|nr:hypothetical protein [Candidatus Saccharibacteria bacterium]